MDEIAKNNGTKCRRYYMLDTMCHMMCENKAGEIVATNIAPELMNGEVCNTRRKRYDKNALIY